MYKRQVQRDVPFKILVSNFGAQKQFLARESIIAYAVRHHSMLVTLEGEEAKDIGRALAFHVPETKQVVQEEEEETEVGEVTTIDGPVVEPPPEQVEKKKPKEPPDWRNSVDLSHIEDEKLKKKIMDMLERHQSMWDGHLGEIKATAHRIALKPNSRPIRQQPYHAGPK